MRDSFGAEEHVYPATVTHVLSMLSPQSRMLELRTEVMQQDGMPPLLLGSHVRVELEGSEQQGLLAIPNSALRKGKDIWVVEGGVLRIVPVTRAFSNDDTTYVRAAAMKEYTLITSNLSGVLDGMAVELR